MGDTQPLDIARLGAQGDGVADTPAGPVFVPYVLAGERVQADLRGERARLVAVLNPSPNRIAPICRHFTHCGGCALQHVERGTYLAWKRDVVSAGFDARCILAPVGHVPPQTPPTLGPPRGNEIVDLQECPVTASAIVRALPGLKRLVEPLATQKFPVRLTVTLAANGLDVALDDVPGNPSP